MRQHATHVTQLLTVKQHCTCRYNAVLCGLISCLVYSCSPKLQVKRAPKPFSTDGHFKLAYYGVDYRNNAQGDKVVVKEFKDQGALLGCDGLTGLYATSRYLLDTQTSVPICAGQMRF